MMKNIIKFMLKKISFGVNTDKPNDCNKRGL